MEYEEKERHREVLAALKGIRDNGNNGSSLLAILIVLILCANYLGHIAEELKLLRVTLEKPALMAPVPKVGQSADNSQR